MLRPEMLPLPLYNFVKAKALFSAAIQPEYHLLNLYCGKGPDLSWLLRHGNVVSAVEPLLDKARQASLHHAIAVRVSPLRTLTTVVPYQGIWCSRPLTWDPNHLPSFTAQLAPLCALLAHGAMFALALTPNQSKTLRQQTDSAFWCAHGLAYWPVTEILPCDDDLAAQDARATNRIAAKMTSNDSANCAAQTTTSVVATHVDSLITYLLLKRIP